MKKNELANFLLDVGTVGAIIGGVYFGKKQGYGFGAKLGIALLFAAPFVATKIILIKKTEPWDVNGGK